MQLILLRHALQHALENARANAPVQAHQVSLAEPIENKDASATLIPPEQQDEAATTLAGEEEISATAAETAVPNNPVASDPSDLISRPAGNAGSSESSTNLQAEEESYLIRCVRDIAEQLQSVPARNFPSVSAILLGGCKLLIATWEAQAFGQSDETSKALQRTVAARTILHVCMERHKKNEPTDLGAAMDIARGQIDEMKIHVEAAKAANNIDSAVNLAATTKRLSSLIAEGEKIIK